MSVAFQAGEACEGPDKLQVYSTFLSDSTWEVCLSLDYTSKMLADRYYYISSVVYSAPQGPHSDAEMISSRLLSIKV